MEPSSKADAIRVIEEAGVVAAPSLRTLWRHLGRHKDQQWRDAACQAGVHAPAQTLLAMDIDPELALGALRLSLGRGTVEADIHAAVSALAEAAQS
ncbi:hypothetical protein HGQ17_09305 [Nesterenkonia sp. MY13]|uniref:Uncharacterized protein n=1 Tax=Nesterenkonia sedimenti TaxID=1463632 RepID=A0A7X8TJX3_9MICC|nr:hypothetical protein [Nesterenkonia sedimenti]NLS10190.1 hypothetical protein [Nesterenkonia sedimenti]